MQTVDMQSLAVYPDYESLSAVDYDTPFDATESGSGSTTATSPSKKKTGTQKKVAKSLFSSGVPASSASGSSSGGTDNTGQSTAMVYAKMDRTNALIGALIGGVLGYAYKKEIGWAMGGAAIGFMGTNLYETKSIFGN